MLVIAFIAEYFGLSNINFSFKLDENNESGENINQKEEMICE